MPAPQEVIDLIERFARNRDVYRSHGYNETETRREFIDPLFKALGWDIDNEQGYAEARAISEAKVIGYREQLDKI